MKIGIKKPGLDKPAVLDVEDRIRFDFDPEADVRIRHDRQLVLKEAVISLEYDRHGYLIGLELIKQDPATLTVEPPDYLRPENLPNPLEKP